MSTPPQRPNIDWQDVLALLTAISSGTISFAQRNALKIALAAAISVGVATTMTICSYNAKCGIILELAAPASNPAPVLVVVTATPTVVAPSEASPTAGSDATAPTVAPLSIVTSTVEVGSSPATPPPKSPEPTTAEAQPTDGQSGAPAALPESGGAEFTPTVFDPTIAETITPTRATENSQEAVESPSSEAPPLSVTQTQVPVAPHVSFTIVAQLPAATPSATQTPVLVIPSVPTLMPEVPPVSLPTRIPSVAPTSAPMRSPTPVLSPSPVRSTSVTSTSAVVQTPTSTVPAPTASLTAQVPPSPELLPSPSATADLAMLTATSASEASPILTPPASSTPTAVPTVAPPASFTPTLALTMMLTVEPTTAPTVVPRASSTPTLAPTMTLTAAPTVAPSASSAPMLDPTMAPTAEPSAVPTAAPAESSPVVNDALVCPDGMQEIARVEGDLAGAAYTLTNEHPFRMAQAGTIVVVGYIEEGHPSSCPNGPVCNQRQEYEALRARVNEDVLGEHRDQGPDDHWWPIGPPWHSHSELDVGVHVLTVEHLYSYDRAQSVAYRMAVCGATP